MPSKKPRINLTLPDDLQGLVEKDSAARRLPEATRVMQILDEHYKRVALETQQNYKVLKGSELLAARPDVTMDFSGGAYSERTQSDEPSQGEAGA